MLTVVSYDIHDDRRRIKVAKCMESYGTRVQWSVFDCILDDRALLQLTKKLQEIIDQEVDTIRFYRVCTKCRNNISIMGTGTFTRDKDVVIL